MSQINVNQIVDASGGVLAPISSVMRNRIINGAMVIDQRNAGASVTPTASTYTLDRWNFQIGAASKLSVQQNAGSVTPPAGFKNYIGFTSTSAYTVGSAELFDIRQSVEGFNTSDLGLGAAGASTITISFWVRSSLTGTFGGFVSNSAYNRVYVFSYTISAANTWEQKTVTIAGDTTGTWLGATNGIGLTLSLTLAAGSAYQGSAGSWQAGTAFAVTGTTSVVGTNGATFYITGVQLEKGTQATSYEYENHGVTLQKCQRYFEKSVAQSVSITANSQTSWSPSVYSTTLPNSSYYSLINFCVTKRTAPTVTIYPYGTATNTGRVSNDVGTDLAANSGFVGIANENNCSVANSSGGSITTGSQLLILGNWYASAEL